MPCSLLARKFIYLRFSLLKVLEKKLQGLSGAPHPLGRAGRRPTTLVPEGYPIMSFDLSRQNEKLSGEQL